MTMNMDTNEPQSGNILIIDDTPANLQLLMGLLSQKGYTVRPVPSGKLALQGIHFNYPDLILLDISMPDMDGYQVCQELKKNEKTREIPVIFVSAFDDVLDKLKAFEVGGIDYITKPFNDREVLARVKTHISLYRLQQQLQEKTKIQDMQLADQNALLQKINQKLELANQELCQRLQQLQDAQLQLVESEKMATLGQLVAGIAHEINNPIGFLKGNIEPAKNYVEDLLSLIEMYGKTFPNPGAAIQKQIEQIDLDFLREDLPKLINSMNLGVERIRHITNSLRIFSRTDSDRKVSLKIHEGIESTLLILKHRIKANENRPEILIVKNYGDLPEICCFPGQLNQVFMNLLSNAIDALEESNEGRNFADIKANPNKILIQTRLEKSLSASGRNAGLTIKIADNGIGMKEEVRERIFDQGFTTKSVGKGTGLGLAIARKIVTEKHHGTLTCASKPGIGTEFTIWLPTDNC